MASSAVVVFGAFWAVLGNHAVTEEKERDSVVRAIESRLEVKIDNNTKARDELNAYVAHTLDVIQGDIKKILERLPR